jgi:hypothetical protein
MEPLDVVGREQRRLGAQQRQQPERDRDTASCHSAVLPTPEFTLEQQRRRTVLDRRLKPCDPFELRFAAHDHPAQILPMNRQLVYTTAALFAFLTALSGLASSASPPAPRARR